MSVLQSQNHPELLIDPNLPQPVLAELTPTEHQAIQLRKEGLSFSEIGERFGCSEGGVLDYVRRASAKLAQSASGLLDLEAAGLLVFGYSNPEPLRKALGTAAAKAAIHALASSCGTRRIFCPAED